MYARLAADNIKRNAQTYVPYIITCIITTAMTYIIRSLASNDGLMEMQGGWALAEILALGSHITRIHSQIITVFFLPLLTAGIHTGFAFPMIYRLLVMFNMTNTKLFARALLICFAAFAVLYSLTCSMTARTYYRIVSK